MRISNLGAHVQDHGFSTLDDLQELVDNVFDDVKVVQEVTEVFVIFTGSVETEIVVQSFEMHEDVNDRLAIKGLVVGICMSCNVLEDFSENASKTSLGKDDGVLQRSLWVVRMISFLLVSIL